MYYKPAYFFFKRLYQYDNQIKLLQLVKLFNKSNLDIMAFNYIYLIPPLKFKVASSLYKPVNVGWFNSIILRLITFNEYHEAIREAKRIKINSIRGNNSYLSGLVNRNSFADDGSCVDAISSEIFLGQEFNYRRY